MHMRKEKQALIEKLLVSIIEFVPHKAKITGNFIQFKERFTSTKLEGRPQILVKLSFRPESQLYDLTLYLLGFSRPVVSQLLWLEMTLFSKKASHKIEKH